MAIARESKRIISQQKICKIPRNDSRICFQKYNLAVNTAIDPCIECQAILPTDNSVYKLRIRKSVHPVSTPRLTSRGGAFRQLRRRLKMQTDRKKIIIGSPDAAAGGGFPGVGNDLSAKTKQTDANNETRREKNCCARKVYPRHER